MSSDDAFAEEIVEIFAEEVGEVLSQIATSLPLWEAHTGNEAALKEVRRAFHTLKGSGRMVQALDIGELAWAVESMLNRVLDGTLQVQPVIFEVVREACHAVPAMLNTFKNKQATALSGVNFGQVIERANDIVAGKLVKSLRGAVTTQLSEELLAQTRPASGERADLVELGVIKERLAELGLSLNDLKRQFITMNSELDSIQAQVKTLPKAMDPIAINKQLRQADQEIQELKYFIKAASEKMLSDNVEQLRRLDGKVDRELKAVTNLGGQMDEQVQELGQQLKLDFSRVVKAWALAAAGFSVLFSLMLHLILK